MGRKGDHPSLHERLHGTPPPRAPDAPAVKHCWVTDRHGRLPGLLLEWRGPATGWQGGVVRPVLEGGAWIMVEEWLPAELLEQGLTPACEPTHRSSRHSSSCGMGAAIWPSDASPSIRDISSTSEGSAATSRPTLYLTSLLAACGRS